MMLAILFRDRRNYMKKTTGAAAIVQLALVLLTIILVSLSRNAIFTYAILAVIFLAMAILPGEEIKNVLKMTIPAVLLTMLVMLPAVFMGSPRSLFTVSMKVFVSVGALGIYNSMVTWSDTTRALRMCHIPSVFVLILDTAVHFLMILGRVSETLTEAVKLRTVSRVSWKRRGTGGVLGTTYLLSEKMSQQTMEAMQTRCFTGQYPTMKKHRINIFDVVYFIAAAVEIAAFIVTQSAMKGIN